MDGRPYRRQSNGAQNTTQHKTFDATGAQAGERSFTNLDCLKFRKPAIPSLALLAFSTAAEPFLGSGFKGIFSVYPYFI